MEKKIEQLAIVYSFLNRNRLPKDDFFKLFGKMYASQIKKVERLQGIDGLNIDWEKMEKNPLLMQLVS